jgi:hypothetical protein
MPLKVCRKNRNSWPEPKKVYFALPPRNPRKTPNATIAAPSAIRTKLERTKNAVATTPTPRTTSDTPSAKSSPLLMGSPVYTCPEASVSWGEAMFAAEFLRSTPTGARTALAANNTSDNSWNLATGLGMQLHVADAKMLGVTFAVAVTPTTPKAPKRIANVR